MGMGQGLQGAAGGFMAGGALGGPVGGAIGGILGGLGGLFGGDGGHAQQDARLQQAYNQYGNRQAPRAGVAQLATPSHYEANRAALMGQLTALSNGQGPSLAQGQMREAMDRAAGSQGALAAGAAGRGMSAGGAYRNAANQTAAIQSQGARDTGMMRTQEQLGAMQQLGGVIDQGVGAQNQMGQWNAGQQNQMSIQNMDAQLRTMGLNDAARMQILQQMGGNVSGGMGSAIMAGGAQLGSYYAGMHGAGNAANNATPGG